MKRVHTWKEPWKKVEPGARLSNKEKVNEGKAIIERSIMEENSAQIVKVIFDKKLWGMPQQIMAFRVEMKLPLLSAEIMQRMAVAFPELELLKEEL